VWSPWRIWALLAAILAFPAGWTVFQVLNVGPGSWSISQTQPWGMPIAGFVFWIGLAHAGTFFSALLLLLGKKWREELAVPAERATLAAWLAAVVFPLLHLGLPNGVFLMIPHTNTRALYPQLLSPLFWDAVAIGAYGLLSGGFYLLETRGNRGEILVRRLKNLAWLLVPLVVLVHTLVSLDFALTRRAAWSQDWFPFYFLAGALYSGIAWVMLASGKRMTLENRRRLSGLLLGMAWVVAAFWGVSMLRGFPIGMEIIVFGFIIPQLLWWPRFASSRKSTMLVAIGCLGAMYWERVTIVMDPLPRLSLIDLGLGCVGFFIFFFGLAILSFPSKVSPIPLRPGTRGELVGSLVLGAVLSCIGIAWLKDLNGIKVAGHTDLPWWGMMPLLISSTLALAGLFQLLRAPLIPRLGYLMIVPGLLTGGLIAVVVGQYPPAYKDWPKAKVEGPQWNDKPPASPFGAGPRPAELLNTAFCAVCHGATGYEKTALRKHYPYPRKPRGTQWDSMGVDSLKRVVLEGRAYMNAFSDRISP